jgi:hypothetical protein
VLPSDPQRAKNVTFFGLPFKAPGAIDNAADLTLVDCTIGGNSGDEAAVQNEGTLTLIDCTIADNTAGAIDSYGGSPSVLTLRNSTVSGNTAVNNIGGIYSDGVLTLQDSTITNNAHGGIYFSPQLTGIAMTCSNTIIADYFDGPFDSFPADVTTFAAHVNSLGHNLVGNGQRSTGWIASDLVGNSFAPIDPRLAPLGNYGGPTQTRPPLAGSPAIGAGSLTVLPNGLTADQRGLPRTVGGALDIGAVQTQSPVKIQVAPSAPQHVPAGKPVSVHVGEFTAPAGSAPFVVSIDWGDGSPLAALKLTAGSQLGSRTHRFTAGGNLAVSISMTDRFGDRSNLATVAVDVSTAKLLSVMVNTIADRTDPPAARL